MIFFKINIEKFYLIRAIVYKLMIDLEFIDENVLFWKFD